MEANISEPGLYFFPGRSEDPSPKETELWMQKLQAGPVGLMTYMPDGSRSMAVQLGCQLLTSILAVLIAACLLSHTSMSYAKRVVFVTLVGVVGWFIDPEGNKVELWEPKEGGLP
jgi:hypothetical protein